MFDKESPVLVIGAGSIGERHIRNLLTLGYNNIYVFRERHLPLRIVQADQITIVSSFKEVEHVCPQVAFICTPSVRHLSQTIQCAERNMHVFVEKPLSHTLVGIDQLQATIAVNRLYVQVGYMMRFHPLVVRVKKLITNQTLGRLLSFSTHWGEYLPDWHPWEDYRNSYAARKELGGGAALTLSHDLDVVNWIVASPVESFCTKKNYASSLEIDVEAGVDFLISYQNGVTGHVHLNFFEQPAKRFYQFIFEQGSVQIDYYNSTMHFKTQNGENMEELSGFDRNQLFVDQTIDFFQRLTTYSLEESLQNIAESEQIIQMCQ